MLKGATKNQEHPKTPSLVVWAAISSKGRPPLIFIPNGVKIIKEVYVNQILEVGLIPWTDELYPGGDWTFQQDGATSHTANLSQLWCKNNCPCFLTKEEWPPKFRI